MIATAPGLFFSTLLVFQILFPNLASAQSLSPPEVQTVQEKPAPPSLNTDSTPQPVPVEPVGTPAREAGPGKHPFSLFESAEQQELILKMHFKRYLMSDGFIGYMHRGGLLLPLNEMARILEFPITVDPDAGLAEGWFLAENRRFSLDVEQGKVVVEGKTDHFNKDLVSVKLDDIYVDTTLLSRWFPVDFEFELSSLVVTLTSRETLPFEERLKREQIRERLGLTGLEKPKYPRLDIPYKFWDWPALDLSYTSTYQSVDRSTSGAYSAVMSGDFLWMNSSVFVSGDHDDPLTGARFLLGRVDPDGGLLGPLHVTEYSLGDVFTPQIPLVTGSSGGAGIQISSAPLFQQSEFDRTNLRGELPLGWEVELYRNEVLLDSQASRADGRYEFLDVPLLFGNNVLRLIFYGPQGQKREKIQTFAVGSGQIRPGEHFFRVSANLKEADLFDIAEDEVEESYNDLARYTVQYHRGLSRRFSLATAFASLPLENSPGSLETNRVYFGSLGLRGAIWGTFSRLDAVRDSEDGTAFEFATQTNVWGINFLAEYSQFFDYVSERVVEETDPLEIRSNVRLDSTIPSWWFLPRIPLSFTGRMERRESGRTDYDLSNRISMFTGGISFSNTLRWDLTRDGNVEPTTQVEGSFLLSARLLSLSLRGGLEYDIHPVTELASASVTGDYNITPDFSARLTIDQQLSGSDLTTVTAGLNRRYRAFALGLTGSYNSNDAFTAGATLTFSFGHDPRRRVWMMLSDRLATTGSASARVYLDKNQNNKFDEADEPLEGVQFQPSGRDIKTDKEGLAYLPGLSINRPTGVNVQKKTLEDPFWLLSHEGYEIVPRPGRSALLNFPVISTGEVDGTVYLLKGDTERAVSNVQMQLIDDKGEVVKKEKTAYDGFYLFTLVPPGTYILRIAPEQVQRLKLKTPREQKVVISGEGNVESGLNIVLELQSEPSKDDDSYETQP